jgi:hypothetical protein
MSTRIYGLSALASLVLIASPAAPSVQEFFTVVRDRGEVTTRLRELLDGVGPVESATVVTDRATGSCGSRPAFMDGVENDRCR